MQLKKYVGICTWLDLELLLGQHVLGVFSQEYLHKEMAVHSSPLVTRLGTWERPVIACSRSTPGFVSLPLLELCAWRLGGILYGFFYGFLMFTDSSFIFHPCLTSLDFVHVSLSYFTMERGEALSKILGKWQEGQHLQTLRTYWRSNSTQPWLVWEFSKRSSRRLQEVF